MKQNSERAHIVVLGNFDGVHRGHLALLARARELGDALSLPVLAYTFRDLPSPPPQLLSPEEKECLLLAGGADRVLTASFPGVRDLSPRRFAEEVLIGQLHTAYAVCGFNFRFGKGAEGDADALISLMGGNACAVPAVLDGGEPVSSTRIRALLANGVPERAAALLTRPYAVSLPVLHGKQLGRTLGFPTANQRIPAFRVTPKHGVYLTEAETEDGRRWRALTNIGSRPTVNGDETDVTCETYLDGFRGDLYGRVLTVRFLSFLREQRRFDSAEALAGQLRNDIRVLHGEEEKP